MDFSWLKRSMPRGLYGRVALILLLPVVVLQLVISVVFLQRHFEGVTRQMTNSTVLDLNYLLAELRAASDEETALARTEALREGLNLDLRLPVAPELGDRRMFYDISGRTVIAILHNRLDGVEGIDLAASTRAVRVQVDTPHGLAEIRFDRRRVSASNPHQLLVLMVVTAALMTFVAYLYLRNQLRPITRLAQAAQDFGKGRVVPYKPSGATEVRAAGSAFLDMRNRIERQTQQRTMMLSGVSHDLRTPLTRMKLTLSLMDEGAPERDEMARDVDEMQRLLDAFLDYARDGALDDVAPCDPVEIARDVVEGAQRGGGAVTLLASVCDDLALLDQPVLLRRLAVERALGNLVGNAMRYAQRADVTVTLSERMVRFTVEDDGPGIPETEREEAMRPFSRLDQARNQNRGAGVGLGLAIALDVARTHGGSLRLSDSDTLGGLRADLVLPQ
ncbi:MAG: ATP-binding protein [Celeribacter sp.]|jgi:two-component system osmolarity sensor histidine kinase EnvZ